jgi:hypothetical protein
VGQVEANARILPGIVAYLDQPCHADVLLEIANRKRATVNEELSVFGWLNLDDLDPSEPATIIGKVVDYNRGDVKRGVITGVKLSDGGRWLMEIDGAWFPIAHAIAEVP